MRKTLTVAATLFSIGMLAAPAVACPFSGHAMAPVETAETKKTIVVTTS